MKTSANNQNSGRGGKREGAGRKSEGKKRYTLSLTEKNATRAQKRAPNFSGLVDGLLADWLSNPATPPAKASGK